jgi:Ca2+-binding RTX toxin-like protein
MRGMTTGALAVVLALGWAMPAQAGHLYQWSSHGLNRLWYDGARDGANDVTVTAVPQGSYGASSVTVEDATATVSSTPPACLPLGLNAGRCYVLTSGMSEPFTTLDVVFDEGLAGEPPARFRATGLTFDMSVIGTPGADDFAVDHVRGTTLAAFGGDDRLTSGPGNLNVTSEGGDGDDVIETRNGGYDRVYCGPGNDTVTADPGDVLFDCELVNQA